MTSSHARTCSLARRLRTGGPLMSATMLVVVGGILTGWATERDRQKQTVQRPGDGADVRSAVDLSGLRLVATAASEPLGELPVCGFEACAAPAFDETIESFMLERHITAGSVAVSRDGHLLYQKAFGWADAAREDALDPDAMFRLASVCKPITAAAIRTLMRRGELQADSHVFVTSDQRRDGLLALAPVGQPDPDWGDITISDLLEHRGGWDRAVSGDPMFRQDQIARALGVDCPPTKRDIARYVLGQPLDFRPGQRSAYSNFGYLVLGLVIEQVTGKAYTEAIRDLVFAPIGVADSEIQLGRSLPSQRNRREPVYCDPAMADNLFDLSERVPFPDGGFHLESMDAHGGLIATAKTLTTFLDHYWINGKPRNGGRGDWTFFGSLPGTLTMVRQRTDGLNVAVLLNQRTDAAGKPFPGTQLRTQLETVLDGVDWRADSPGIASDDGEKAIPAHSQPTAPPPPDVLNR